MNRQERRQYVDVLLGDQRPITDEHARAVCHAVISGLPGTDLAKLRARALSHALIASLPGTDLATLINTEVAHLLHRPSPGAARRQEGTLMARLILRRNVRVTR